MALGQDSNRSFNLFLGFKNQKAMIDYENDDQKFQWMESNDIGVLLGRDENLDSRSHVSPQMEK